MPCAVRRHRISHTPHDGRATAKPGSDARTSSRRHDFLNLLGLVQHASYVESGYLADSFGRPSGLELCGLAA